MSFPAVSGNQLYRLVSQVRVPVIVEAWSCGEPASHTQSAVLDELGGVYGDGVRIARLDVDAYPQTARALGIRRAPTLVIFFQGQELARLEGLTSVTTIETMLERGLRAQAQRTGRLDAVRAWFRRIMLR